MCFFFDRRRFFSKAAAAAAAAAGGGGGAAAAAAAVTAGEMNFDSKLWPVTRQQRDGRPTPQRLLMRLLKMHHSFDV